MTQQGTKIPSDIGKSADDTKAVQDKAAGTKTAKSEFFQLKIRLWGLVAAAGAIAGVASILAFFGSFYWFLDLLTHFRVQYFIILGIAALILLIAKNRKKAAVLVLCKA